MQILPISHLINTAEISQRCRESIEPTYIKKDALHLACAVHSNSQYFITTDKKLLNLKLNQIKICKPIDFINEMEG